MNERVTYPISSKQYNEFLLMPYVLEARVHMDLERKRLPFYYLRKDQYDKLLVDNVKVNIDYEILVRKISYIKLDDNDQWAKHLHFLQGEWIGKRKTNADSPYWKQLITASALNRSALLYMSLHNATFGQANTDFDALNEIMVTLTNDERDKMCEVYSTEYNLLKRLPRDALCTALQKLLWSHRRRPKY
uniref:DUF3800 domain-containing protein n=1 Tax=Globodera pallida TaxID=36090 RepID=A0A183CJ85_GLOPA